jgi:hypothetical protein
MRPDELERRLQERLDALGPAPAPSCSMSSCSPTSSGPTVRLLMRFWEATGFKHTLDSCEETGRFDFGTVVRCTWDFHAIRSDEIGLGPYSGSYDELTVRDGEIVDVFGEIGITAFSRESWEPFAEWVSTNYPEDVALTYKSDFSDYQLTPESIRLWEQHTRDYVEAVQQGTV